MYRFAGGHADLQLQLAESLLASLLVEAALADKFEVLIAALADHDPRVGGDFNETRRRIGASLGRSR